MKKEVLRIVRKTILPFWQKMADEENGGFFGEADFYGKPDKNASKGCILNSRLLWTFSAAYRAFGDNAYMTCAERARDFLLTAFLDKINGGLYWLADYSGKALDRRKQFYNIAFGIYGLSEFFRATGEQSSLDLAMALFSVMEKYGHDPAAGGYIEACTGDWLGISDYRLSEKDLNSPKSMNTNLHVLEAYTNLLNAGGDKSVRKALEMLLRVTLDKIINNNHHFELFFDMEWNPLSGDVSYGHDIEGSWLLYEAALALKNAESPGAENLVSGVKRAAIAIADGIFAAAIDRENGGLLSGLDAKGKIHAKKEWWPQAEAVVGFYNAYELSGEQKFFDAAADILRFIKNNFIDRSHGEWHNELGLDNKPDTTMPKAGFWKCPYHNARMCFEIMRRINE